mgnify:CR=1 FL=1
MSSSSLQTETDTTQNPSNTTIQSSSMSNEQLSSSVESTSTVGSQVSFDQDLEASDDSGFNVALKGANEVSAEEGGFDFNPLLGIMHGTAWAWFTSALIIVSIFLKEISYLFLSVYGFCLLG